MSSLDSTTHVVQLALTPIFMLTGLASMLNVFTTRLGRVSDRIELLRKDPAAVHAQLRHLRVRSRVLDIAVLLAASGSALTCGAALTLFVDALHDAADGRLIFVLFGGALICLVGALAAFSIETIMSGRAIRELEQGERQDQCQCD